MDRPGRPAVISLPKFRAPRLRLVGRKERFEPAALARKHVEAAHRYTNPAQQMPNILQAIEALIEAQERRPRAWIEVNLRWPWNWLDAEDKEIFGQLLTKAALYTFIVIGAAVVLSLALALAVRIYTAIA